MMGTNQENYGSLPLPILWFSSYCMSTKGAILENVTVPKKEQLGPDGEDSSSC